MGDHTDMRFTTTLPVPTARAVLTLASRHPETTVSDLLRRLAILGVGGTTTDVKVANHDVAAWRKGYRDLGYTGGAGGRRPANPNRQKTSFCVRIPPPWSSAILALASGRPSRALRMAIEMGLERDRTGRG